MAGVSRCAEIVSEAPEPRQGFAVLWRESEASSTASTPPGATGTVSRTKNSRLSGPGVLTAYRAGAGPNLRTQPSPFVSR